VSCHFAPALNVERGAAVKWSSITGMTPELWKQVEEIFQAALDRAPEQRAAFIVEA
jgi:hypothetical protein